MTAPFTHPALINVDLLARGSWEKVKNDAGCDAASGRSRRGDRRSGRVALGLPSVSAQRLSLQCLTVRTRIPSLVDELGWGDEGHDPSTVDESERDQDHISVCLRCQADVAAYRRLRRQLRDVRTHYEPVDSNHVEQILAQVRPAAPVHRLPRYRRRWVGEHWPMLLGGAAATLTAAGAAAAVVIARVVQRPVLSS